VAIRTVGTGYTYSTVQAGIDAAVDGDTVACKANQTFPETVTCPDKGVLTLGILVTSDASAFNLPRSGQRTSPAYAAFMPKIQSPGSGAPAVQFAVGANHYTFQHIEFPEVPTGLNTIISIGYADSTQQFESQEPTDITIDQCYLHGGSICGQQRGIHTAGKRITISNNYFADIKAVSQDSQCIFGANGHGPLTVTNNYLGGGTEPFLLGGDDPRIRTFMTPSGTPTTTSAFVTCTESGHTLAELAIGQTLAVLVGSVWKLTILTSKSGNGSTGTIGFTALSAPPDLTANGIKAGVILDGLTFRYNYVRNDPTWIDGVFPLRSVGPTVTPGSGGSLSAGTYYYKIQDITNRGYFHNGGTTMRSAVSPQASGTVSASGKNTLAWSAQSAATGIDFYRVWRGTTSGVMTQYIDVAAGTTALVDDGTGSWTTSTPVGGDSWVIKNLFELKACVNAQIDSNIFENHWPGGDQGYAIWFKTVDQDGTAPFLQTKNIVLEKNIIRHCCGFLELHGIEAENGGRPGPLTNVTVRNNLVYDSGTDPWRQSSQVFAIVATEGVVNATIDHNTIVHVTTGTAGGALQLDDTVALLSGFVFTNNLTRGETYGIICSGGQGSAGLAAAAPGYSFLKNALSNVSSGSYPANNFYPDDATWEAQFTTYAVDGVGANFAIANGSAYQNAGTDGADIGADIGAVLFATATTLTGVTIVAAGGKHRFRR
jgi:hypothetical protein